MKTDSVFDDKRLLGVLDGVDARFISDALEYYDSPEPGKTKKARRGLVKRIAALAACVVLCAAAFPMVNYILPRFGVYIGNAGAGKNEYSDYDPYVDSAVFAYPDDMPAEEVYADVLEGGWLVYYLSDFNSVNMKTVEGEELWDEFRQKVREGKPALFRKAIYVEKNIGLKDLPEGMKSDGSSCIELTEVVYDGEKYYYSRREIFPSLSGDVSDVQEYKYLKLSKQIYEKEKQFYFLTDDPKLEYWSPFSSASSPDYRIIYYLD